MAKSKKGLLEMLAKVLNSETDGLFGMPTVETPKDDGWDTHTLCWDGPYEWTMILGGSSIYAGELGTYSSPVQKKIAVVLQKIVDAGYFLEPINCAQVGLYNG